MRRGTPAGAMALAALLALLPGCRSVTEYIHDLGTEAERSILVTRGSDTIFNRTAESLAALERDLTPRHEYYIGRAVCANILARYRPYNRPEINRYVNELGQGLAQYSPRPEIYAGYSFLVLDSMEINAFSTPGGHVLLTRGLLSCARSEDELAAILAHEIAHIAYGHGIASIKSARFGDAVARFALETGRRSGGEVARFTEAFGDSITDITTTLVTSGYSRATEFEADSVAREILALAGYNPAALESVLISLRTVVSPGDRGFGETHPSPEARISALRSSRGQGLPVTGVSSSELARRAGVRAARFAAAIRYL